MEAVPVSWLKHYWKYKQIFLLQDDKRVWIEKLARYENKLSHIRAFDTHDLLWWQQATLRSAESLLILYKRLLFVICQTAWELQ